MDAGQASKTEVSREQAPPFVRQASTAAAGDS